MVSDKMTQKFDNLVLREIQIWQAAVTNKEVSTLAQEFIDVLIMIRELKCKSGGHAKQFQYIELSVNLNACRSLFK